jgi:Ca2+:H+ antiporter
LFDKIGGPLNLMLVFVPLCIAARFAHLPEVAIFFLACLGIVPLAGLMGKATEYLAERMGEGPGALLNASFGNACELIIALAALRAGYIDVVKASITGSIVGNMLLVLGASMLAGGMKYETQVFNRTAATTQATMLALAAISLMVPAVFEISTKHECADRGLAIAISIVLFSVYLLSLWFSLKTHRHLYVRKMDAETEDALGITGWGIPKSLTILAVSTVLVAILSELLVHTVEHTGEVLGMNKIFIGVVLVAIVGNAAEHSTAILMARKNKMDLAINIALGSGSQIALFVAPLLVFVSVLIGKPMNLCFTPPEVLSIIASVLILSFVATDGECNWLEGVQLLAVYFILGAAFFFA